MNEVVWGMIGCGAVTEKKSGPGLYKSAHSRVKGVHARHKENAVDYAKRHGIPTVFDKFVDMMVHVIDIVQFFVGNIVDVRGFAANKGGFYEAEDTVCASFRSQSGVLVSGVWCYVSDYDDEELLIVGKKGRSAPRAWRINRYRSSSAVSISRGY